MATRRRPRFCRALSNRALSPLFCDMTGVYAFARRRCGLFGRILLPGGMRSPKALTPHARRRRAAGWTGGGPGPWSRETPPPTSRRWRPFGTLCGPEESCIIRALRDPRCFRPDAPGLRLLFQSADQEQLAEHPAIRIRDGAAVRRHQDGDDHLDAGRRARRLRRRTRAARAVAGSHADPGPFPGSPVTPVRNRDSALA